MKTLFVVLKGGRYSDGSYPSNRFASVFASNAMAQKVALVSNQESDGIFSYVSTLANASDQIPKGAYFNYSLTPAY